MKDILSSDILGMKVTTNDGQTRDQHTLYTMGAKDSLGGTNVTEPFEPASVAIPSPKGGTVNGKNMK